MRSSSFACLLFGAGVACSTGSSGGGGPPVDPSKELSALSVADLQALCDWSVHKEGGYGKSTPCDATGAPLETPSSQAECVAELMPHFSRPTCTTTVGQWTTCAEWLFVNWCSTMPPAKPAGCDAFQAGCYGAVADGGRD